MASSSLSGSFHTSECRGGVQRRQVEIGVHHAIAVVWEPVYRTHLIVVVPLPLPLPSSAALFRAVCSDLELVQRRDVRAVVIPREIQRAPLAQRVQRREQQKHAAAKRGVVGFGKPSKEVVARPKHDELPSAPQDVRVQTRALAFDPREDVLRVRDRAALHELLEDGEHDAVIAHAPLAERQREI
eukprot:31552-Pelagococcus_subviridis.AAC.8